MSEHPLPSIKHLRFIALGAILIELTILVILEFAFLHDEVHRLAKKHIEPLIESSITPAQKAIISLSPSLAERVADGLISSGYFEEVTIYDDYSDILGRVTRKEKELPTFSEHWLTVILGLKTHFPIVRLIETNHNQPGRLVAHVNLNQLMVTKMRESIIRTTTIVGITLLLTISVLSHFIRRFEKGVGNLTKWTSAAAHNKRTTLSSTDLVYQEFEVLAKRTSQAFAEQREFEKRSHHAEKLEALGRVSSGVAHEFNNMLNIMMGEMEEVLAVTDPKAEVAEFLQSANRAGERAKAIIAQLHQLSLDTPLTQTSIDLQEWRISATHFLSAVIGPGVHLNFHFEKGLLIKADPTLFDAAIVNLCKNAADAMLTNGEIRIEAKVADAEEVAQHLHIDKAAKYVCISIYDNGPGIPHDAAEQIFEPFYTTKHQTGGAGLGLSTVFGFLKKSGGSIRLDRQYDQGACFRLLLRQGAVNESVKPNIQATSSSSIRLEKTRLLIVDDEISLAQIFNRLFTRAGATVTVCNSIADTRTVLKTKPQFDCAILDNSLADGVGTSLIPEIKALNPDCYCLCVSGAQDQHTEWQSNVDEFVSKPVSLNVLLRTVAEAIGCTTPSGHL